MRIFFLCSLLTFTLAPLSFSQIKFSPTNQLVDVKNFRSAAPIGITDLNGSLLDDLFRLHNGRSLQIDFQVSPGKFQTIVSDLTINNDLYWNIAAADLNNDGLSDIISSGSFGSILHLSQIKNGEFELGTLDGVPPFFAQGSNFIDINKDGFVDLFICDDLAESKIFGNDGNGSLIPMNDWINMATTPPSDNSGNYGSVWADVNGNGKMDLYISKCRAGVNSSSDPRRINALFLDMGNGQYTEAAAEIGIANGAQSWAADFADVRNIGLNDLFLINHDSPSVFYRNNGQGNYEDVTSESGISNQSGHIQLKFFDLDNDGYLDLMISGNGMTIYRNLGDGTFEMMANPFDPVPIHSFSVGDLNNNGFLDIYTSYGSGYNTPSESRDDILWLNPGNENNWLRIRLNGTESNKDGIGAIVRVYSELGMQTREARAGESYGIQTSNILHFGMADNGTADSVIIKWPSGIEDRFYNLSTRNIYLATEGLCITEPVEIEYEGDLLLCNKDFIPLSLPDSYAYRWSTGDTNKSIEVNVEGSYFARLIGEDGCETPTEVLHVIEDEDFSPTLQTVFERSICNGNSLSIRVDSDWEVVWSNGSLGNTIEIREEGLYYAKISNSCGEFFSDSVYIEELFPQTPIVLTENIQYESEIILRAEGEQIKWFLSPEDEQPAFEGPEWTVSLDEGENYFYLTNTSKFEGLEFKVGKIDFSGSNNYHANHLNGALFFNTQYPVRLNSVKIYTELDGPRVFTLLSTSGAIILKDTVNITDAVNGARIELNWDIPIGNDWTITTDPDFNLMTYGHRSPRLYRSNNEITFPYQNEPYVSIISSNFGLDNYYYFYDWDVSLSDKFCESEKLAFEVIFDTGVNVPDQNLDTEMIKIFPNPGLDLIHLELALPCLGQIEFNLIDLSGKNHISTHLSPNSNKAINTSQLLPGLYIIKVLFCESIYHTLWIKL